MALRSEWVYYRAAAPGNLHAPARILWYVSDKGRFAGRKSLRAYSRLDEVVVDLPKHVFRRFRRLGIYEWRDILRTAKGKLETKIMALRFTGNELFRSPISWEAVQSVLKRNGINTQIRGPTRVPPQVFRELYTEGTKR